MPTPTITVSVRLTAAEYDALKARAVAQKVTATFIATMAIRKELGK